MPSLHHISIRTFNLENLFEFYMAHFCKDIAHTFIASDGSPYGYMLNFISGGIIELMKTNDSLTSASEGISAGFHHMCLATNDLDAYIRNMPAKYIIEPVKIGRTDFIRQLMLCDPDGNKIELHEYN